MDTINEKYYSPDGIRWLDFVAKKEKHAIEHVLNGRGEKNIQGLSADGYCDNTRTIYQYHVSYYLTKMNFLTRSDLKYAND